jgi:hypothetical protein
LLSTPTTLPRMTESTCPPNDKDLWDTEHRWLAVPITEAKRLFLEAHPDYDERKRMALELTAEGKLSGWASYSLYMFYLWCYRNGLINRGVTGRLELGWLERRRQEHMNQPYSISA